MDVKDLIKSNAEESEHIADALRATHNREQFECGIRKYVMLRFLLEDDGQLPDNLDELARLSVKEALRRSDDPASLSDLGINCAGASSALTKRLLLIIALRKALGIDIDPESAALCKTVPDLADLLFRAMMSVRQPE